MKVWIMERVRTLIDWFFNAAADLLAFGLFLILFYWIYKMII